MKDSLLSSKARQVLNELVASIDFFRQDVDFLMSNRDQLRKFIIEILVRDSETSHDDHEKIITMVFSWIFGLGPIQKFMDDDSISEIMVNGKDTIFVERGGKLTLTEESFEQDEDVMNIINRIVGSVGRRIDESSPMVDARLHDGSRVNAIIPPLSICGPVLTIRKFPRSIFTLPLLVKKNTVSTEGADLLRECIENKQNIIIVGGTGSGKTSTLNALVNAIPHGERIITIEDAVEIQTKHPHRVALETRPANIEGTGEISMRVLVKNALRMRPDRIIVGEIRGAESFDMLQAMNTGHKGSLSTVHANSPQEGLLRIETMAMMAGMEMPHSALREQIIQAIDVVIFQERLPDGKRRITQITQLDKSSSREYILKNCLHE